MQLLVQVGQLLLAIFGLLGLSCLDIRYGSSDEPDSFQLRIPRVRPGGSLHLADAVVHRRFLRQGVQFSIGELKQATLAVLRRDLGAYDAQLLLSEGGLGGDFLQELCSNECLVGSVEDDGSCVPAAASRSVSPCWRT